MSWKCDLGFHLWGELKEIGYWGVYEKFPICLFRLGRQECLRSCCIYCVRYFIKKIMVNSFGNCSYVSWEKISGKQYDNLISSNYELAYCYDIYLPENADMPREKILQLCRINHRVESPVYRLYGANFFHEPQLKTFQIKALFVRVPPPEVDRLQKDCQRLGFNCQRNEESGVLQERVTVDGLLAKLKT